MAGPKIHFLNVGAGDCFLIERDSGRNTVIDICNGNSTRGDLTTSSALRSFARASTDSVQGNFRMCEHPTNPITYFKERSINSIFRFILSHPDMDHMDGIERLFESSEVLNFWDCGIRKEKPDFERNGPYREEDWDFYSTLLEKGRDGLTVVSPRSGDRGRFWGADDDAGTGNGDYLSVLSPTKVLVDDANTNGDINDGSYVIVYRSSAGRVIFPGDSNDKVWHHILRQHRDLVEDAAVLFAPHHGRKSDRDYSFLDVVNPRVSFFGCADSEFLAYSAWKSRDLTYFTNNQCGNVVLEPQQGSIQVYVENRAFADKYTNGNTFEHEGNWYLFTA